MTDPFDVLRISDSPVEPRPEFAAELRRALTHHLEEPMTTPSTQTVTAYLIVRNAAAALAFYTDAFGAVEQHRLVGADGRIGHAEMTIGSTKLMLADEHPEYDIVGPESRGGATSSFTIEVADVDTAFAKAIDAGATVVRPVGDQFHGNRTGALRDPFGHQWTLSTPIAGYDPAEYAARSTAEGYDLSERPSQ
jgi:PhnB protein